MAPPRCWQNFRKVQKRRDPNIQQNQIAPLWHALTPAEQMQWDPANDANNPNYIPPPQRPARGQAHQAPVPPPAAPVPPPQGPIPAPRAPVPPLAVHVPLLAAPALLPAAPIQQHPPIHGPPPQPIRATPHHLHFPGLPVPAPGHPANVHAQPPIVYIPQGQPVPDHTRPHFQPPPPAPFAGGPPQNVKRIPEGVKPIASLDERQIDELEFIRGNFEPHKPGCWWLQKVFEQGSDEPSLYLRFDDENNNVIDRVVVKRITEGPRADECRLNEKLMTVDCEFILRPRGVVHRPPVLLGQNGLRDPIYLAQVNYRPWVLYLEYAPFGSLAELLERYCGSTHGEARSKDLASKDIPEGFLWYVFYALCQGAYVLRNGRRWIPTAQNQTKKPEWVERMHIDIKPDNILLADAKPGFLPAYKRPLLADFGLTHDVGRHYPTVPHHILGTPGFMDPRQYLNHLDAADVYAIGLTLWTLTRKQVYGEFGMLPSESDGSDYNRVRAGPPPKNPPPVGRGVSSGAEFYSARLERLVYWCLEELPRKRPTVEALVGSVWEAVVGYGRQRGLLSEVDIEEYFRVEFGKEEFGLGPVRKRRRTG